MIACLFATASLLPSSVFAGMQASANAPTVEKTVRAKFARYPVLIKIADCESGFQQYNRDGSLNYNDQGSSAVGVMQIVSSIHKSDAKKLGFDITTTDGNLDYALYLYRTQSTTPWDASSSCWNS